MRLDFEGGCDAMSRACHHGQAILYLNSGRVYLSKKSFDKGYAHVLEFRRGESIFYATLNTA